MPLCSCKKAEHRHNQNVGQAAPAPGTRGSINLYPYEQFGKYTRYVFTLNVS